MIYLGIDWAEDHHDLCLLSEEGERLATARVPEGVRGLRSIHELVAAQTEDASSVVVGIEIDRGLLVHGLVASGYQVYGINPFAVSRYRDRHATSGAKSDRGDAKILADLVRTDRHNHRPLAGDSDLAEAVKVLARAQQNLLWARQRHVNQLRSALREYYPAVLEAFGTSLSSRDALAVLQLAPTPAAGAQLTVARIRGALLRAGRQRNLEETATAIHRALHAPQLLPPQSLAAAYGAATRATVALLAQFNHQLEQLEAELVASFEQHPDAEILCSLPGLGLVLGARVLAEFGDDPNSLPRCQITALLRRDRPCHSSIWHKDGRDRAHGPQPSHGARLLLVGVLGAEAVTRSSPLLRPPASPGEVTSPGASCPGEPPRRRAPRVPCERAALRRSDCVANPRGGCRLTTYGRGMSGVGDGERLATRIRLIQIG